jgi:hypothetical protein
MTIYTRNQPIATDDLDISQPQLFNNTNAADTIFGFEHYAFSDKTADRGLHNTVTTPSYVATPSTGLPPTTTVNPIFYGFQQTTPLGILQFSRGPNDAVPTPLTNIQSPTGGITLLAGGSTNLLDFTGINIANFYIIAFDKINVNASMFNVSFWNGTSFIGIISIGQGFTINSSGNILQIKNTTAVDFTQVYWTLNFNRIQ